MPDLTLAHSGDPDDAFMWWPLTGKVNPDGTPMPGCAPAFDTGRFRFRAVPGDISEFNRRAAADAPYDITALSVRAYADVQDRYRITAVGGSFGEGYGPKVVAFVKPADALGWLREPGRRIAVPGVRTTAFLTLSLMLGPEARPYVIELGFNDIIPAVVRAEADAGLIIHEGQLTYAATGLTQLVDLGEWWQRTRGLPLPLGVNAVKRDLNARFGPGALREVASLLRASLAHALAHREESVDYTMPYAETNAAAAGLPVPDRARVERYLGMYVSELTIDMGGAGRRAIACLLAEGAHAALCPKVGDVDTI